MRMSDIRVIYSDREQFDEISIDIFASIRDQKKIISEKSNIQMQNIKLCANGKTIHTERIEWGETDITKNQTVFVYHTDPIDSFPIKIRLLNGGDPFEIRFPANATIESLRRLIEYWVGINSEEQQLFDDTTELDYSDELLSQFSGHIIDVLRCTDNFIFLKHDTLALDHKIVPIEVKPNDIVATLKTRAGKKLNTSLEQHSLLLNEKLLNTYDNLSSFIVIGNILYMYPSDTPIQYIYVQLSPTLERIPIELNKSMTVKDVHKRILMYLGLSEDQQKLSFQDHQLDDKSQLLEFYGIIPSSLLQLIQVVSLRIVMTNNCIFSVTLDQFSNVHQLKSIICHKGFAMSIDEQKLIYFGVQLEDDINIKQCRLENNSVILLLIKNNENSDDNSFDHDRFDQFAAKRKNIWASRLAHLDGDDDNTQYSNHVRKITHLFRNDDDDSDDSLYGICCYRADQK